MKSKVLSRVEIETPYGMSHFVSFTDMKDGKEHIAIVFGNAQNAEVSNVRIHSECLTGDIFHSARCDCGAQLHEALKTFSVQGGIVLYLRQEGRGIGLYNKLKAYELQSCGLDTFEANKALGFEEDARDFRVAAQMLEALGVKKIRLWSNNPEKVLALQKMGIDVVERRATKTYIHAGNEKYLQAKKLKGHDLRINMLSLREEKVS
jgi:GTP cyclohydrolase II